MASDESISTNNHKIVREPPKITSPVRSNLLDRARCFLPLLAAANAAIQPDQCCDMLEGSGLDLSKEQNGFDGLKLNVEERPLEPVIEMDIATYACIDADDSSCTSSSDSSTSDDDDDDAAGIDDELRSEIDKNIVSAIEDVKDFGDSSLVKTSEKTKHLLKRRKQTHTISSGIKLKLPPDGTEPREPISCHRTKKLISDVSETTADSTSNYS